MDVRACKAGDDLLKKILCFMKKIVIKSMYVNRRTGWRLGSFHISVIGSLGLGNGKESNGKTLYLMDFKRRVFGCGNGRDQGRHQSRS